MKKNKNAFSLVIVMGIVLVTSLLALTLLELILPFSRSVVGIENASRAYYLANSGLEQKLLDLKKNEKLGNVENNYDTNFLSGSNNQKGIKTNFTNFGTKEPIDGKGDYQNNEYNHNYNTVSHGNPIQIDVSGMINFSDLKIKFLLPNFGNTPFNLDSSKRYISWQLTSNNGEFFESGEEGAISGNRIKDVLSSGVDEKISELKNKYGDKLGDKYTEFGCSSSVKCILKFSIINELKEEIEPKRNIPYLLWDFNGGRNNIFLRYSYIESQGFFNGYTRTLEIKVPKETVNEAFDFAVFQ